jgi:hypothetical protein
LVPTIKVWYLQNGSDKLLLDLQHAHRDTAGTQLKIAVFLINVQKAKYSILKLENAYLLNAPKAK